MGKKSGAAAPVDFKGQEGCLVIQVKNAVKLPNRDLLGESDPFVELELDGESKHDIAYSFSFSYLIFSNFVSDFSFVCYPIHCNHQ